MNTTLDKGYNMISSYLSVATDWPETTVRVVRDKFPVIALVH